MSALRLSVSRRRPRRLPASRRARVRGLPPPRTGPTAAAPPRCASACRTGDAGVVVRAVGARAPTQARPSLKPGLLAIFLTAQIGRAGRWRPVGRSRVGRAGLEVTAPGLSKSIPGGAPAPGLLNTLVQTSAVTRRSAWPKGHPSIRGCQAAARTIKRTTLCERVLPRARLATIDTPTPARSYVRVFASLSPSSF